MGRKCVVSGCKNAINNPKSGLFKFPKGSTDIHTNHLITERKKRWKKILNLSDNVHLESRYICNLHFVSGRPARLTDTRNVDWAPTLALPQKSATKTYSTSSSSDDEMRLKTMSYENLVTVIPLIDSGVVEFDKTPKTEILDNVITFEYPDESRCEFCLKLPEEESQIPVLAYEPWYEPKIRKTIEFVLERDLQSMEVVRCCNSCWSLFETFYEFKTNCLATLDMRKNTLNRLTFPKTQNSKSCIEDKREAKKYSNIVCKLCNKQFDTLQDKREHKRYCFNSSDSEDDAKGEIEQICRKKSKSSTFKEQKNASENFKSFKGNCTKPGNYSAKSSTTVSKDADEDLQQLDFPLPPDYAFGCERCAKQFTVLQEAIEHKKQCFDLFGPKDDEMEAALAWDSDSAEATQDPEECAKDDKRFHFRSGFKFCCIRCKQIYTSLPNLRQHQKNCTLPIDPNAYDLMLNERDNRYHCWLCSSTSKLAQKTREHLNRHYGIKKYMCRKADCKKRFYCRSTQINHEKDCGTNNSYVCSKCGALLKSYDTFRNHMKQHGPPRHECIICSKKFRLRNWYTSHWKAHFRQLGESPSKAHQDGDIGRVEKLPRTIPCEICGKKLPTESVYVRHRRFCNDPKASMPAGKLQCPHCPRMIRSKTTFKYHVDQHNGIRSVKCRKEGCTKAFFNVPCRNSHELNCGKQWICSTCGSMFSNRCTLIGHMAVHSDSPPKCETCGKLFGSMKALKTHYVTHTGEKNHECKLCGQRFTQASSVKTHMKIHTRDAQQLVLE